MSRMGRNKFGHRDVQWIDDGWECATRVLAKISSGRLIITTFTHLAMFWQQGIDIFNVIE